MEIKIRQAEPDDFAGIHRIFAGPKAIWGTLQVPYTTAEVWRKRLAEADQGRYNLVATTNDEIIGCLTLITSPNRPRRRHVGHIGMAVRDDWQGKGVGSALMQECIDLADKWLNLTRLELEVFTDNPAAIALYKKFGFAIEGTRIKDSFRDGIFVDSYAMARLRS